jgi:transcriptional regulator GlxA family with amidase domain
MLSCPYATDSGPGTTLVTKDKATIDVPTDTATKPARFGFLLLPGFPLMSYASAVEPLRAANNLKRQTLYEWVHLTYDGGDLVASNGVRFPPDAKLADAEGLDSLFVCAGGNPSQFDHPPTFSRLRELAHAGVRLGGMSGGSYVLARAHLLDGYRCTIHWEHIPAFVEEFPRLSVERTLFVADRDRITCAGGIAALDMMIELIAQRFGATLSNAVSEWYLHTRTRQGTDSQRMALRERTGVANERLLKPLAAMETHLENPLSREALAEIAGITLRQLERLFAEHLGTTIARRYGEIRLDRAKSLLRQSTLSVAEIAVACGFVSTSHFSKVYKARFGRRPRQEREIGLPMDLPAAFGVSYKGPSD